MAKVDELTVEILGDIKGLTKALKESVDQTEKTTSKMSSSFEKVTKSITGVQAGFAKFGLAVQGAKTALGPFVSLMQKINDVSGLKRTASLVGVNVERFQELSFAARSVGVDSETFADALKDLNVKITDAANGATGYEEVLNLIGLKSSELLKIPVDKQFEAFAEAMSKANSETRRFVADEINDSMFQLNTLLEKGADGLSKYSKEARQLGLVMSSKEMEEVENLNIEFKKLTGSTEALAGKLISKLSPAIKAIMTVANGAAEAVGEIFDEEKQSNSRSISELIKEQDDKIKLLKVDLINAETALFDFENSWSKAFFPEEESLLKLEVDELNRKIIEARENIESLKTANNSLGGLMTGSGSFEDEGLTAQGTVVTPEGGESQNETGGLMTGMPWILTEEGQSQTDAMRELEIQKQQDFNARLREIEEYNQEYNKMLWESGWKGKLDIMGSTFGKMGKLMNSESRKMFEIGKAARIAEVIATTPKAAMDAYSAMASIPYVGPALGAAAAASAIAYGAQQVQQIQSTQFRGGGGGGGGAGPSVPDAGSAEGGGQEVVQTTNFDITLQGDSFGGDQLRGLIGQINEATDDGVKLNAVMVR